MGKQNLKPFKTGQEWNGNQNGRPKGSKNRSTIAKQILEKEVIIPDIIREKLKAVLPDLGVKATLEQLMTLALAIKAIERGNTLAYLAILDSAYGRPASTSNEESTVTVNVIRENRIQKIDEDAD